MQKISFLLSSLNRAGGSRVTVEMGNLLIKRGYRVRILAGKPRSSIKQIIKTLLLKLSGCSFYDWGKDFNGEIVYFNYPNDVNSLLSKCFK